MTCFSKVDMEEMEQRLCVLEATVHAAVKELEEDKYTQRVAFGLHVSLQNYRDLFEQARRQVPKT